MSIFKPRQSTTGAVPVSSRRSFIWKLGTGASAALASASGWAHAGNTDGEKASGNIVRDEENSIRKLHKQFESMLDQGSYSDVHSLFTENAEVVFNSGVFTNRDQGIRRLYSEIFSAGLTGKRMEQAPGFELSHEAQDDRVSVSSDLLSARAVFTYSIQVGKPMDDESQLVQMARLHGEGIRKWWEGGLYEVTYLKDSNSGNWKISSLIYNTLSRADYRQGRSWARSVAAEEFVSTYPRDLLGPDRLV